MNPSSWGPARDADVESHSASVPIPRLSNENDMDEIFRQFGGEGSDFSEVSDVRCISA